MILDINKKTAYDSLTLSELQGMVQTCQACPLHAGRKQAVFGSGNKQAVGMFIGEGPGAQEDEDGVPFVGRAGQLLTKILASVGIQREDVYIANTVKCRPPNNRTPNSDELLACQDFLIRQIQLIQPKILVLLGSAALRSVIGNEITITKARGQWLSKSVNYMDDDLYIMPMFHPSYLLRYASKEKGSPKWLTWQDMKDVQLAMTFYDTMGSL